MDRYGCDMMWMTASNPGYSGDISEKNDLVFDFAEQYPNRIIPYCVISAHTPERNVAELQRCIARGHCIGVKMHRYRQPEYTMRSEFLQPIFELLSEHGLVYMNHGYVSLPDLEWALERYPDQVFIGGHFGPDFYRPVLRYPNFYDCTCAAQAYNCVDQEIRQHHNSDKLLVGSDFSLFQLGFGIGMIAYTEMAEGEKQNILGGNALKLLDRTAWFRRSMLKK
jgi:predicted TIM-barrel fold metal-dependent hydrolase